MRRTDFLLALVLLAPPVHAQVGASADTALTSLRTADSAWNAASISRSVDRMMSFYAPNATADLGGAPARGSDAIRRLWTRAYADSAYMLSWTNTHAERIASTELAYTIGAWKLVRSAGTQTGTYFAVWQRQADGRWLVLIDTAR